MIKLSKERSLAYLNSELSKEWDYEKNYPLTPEDVFLGSRKIVWWICKKGHSYDASLNNRNSGSGCPYCSIPARKVCIDNCLATLNPELAKEWDYEKNYPLSPFDVTQHSIKIVWWICKKRHSYDTIIDYRSSGSGCPYCSGQKVCIDNCLATLNPELAKEWHPTKNGKLTPYDVTYGSGAKVWWKCSKGHEWDVKISDRNHGNGCPYCSGRYVCEDNCLATINSELAKEWNYEKNQKFTPYNVMPNSHKKAYWICKVCQYEWMATVNNRSNATGCPSCHKIELKDDTIWDSLTEAYYYLELKNKNIKFKNHVGIGLGRCTCDFYIPSVNGYIEVTGYNDQWTHWETYYKNILRKKKHITKKLKANFEFVQIELTSKQIQYVRENAI